MYFVTIGSPHIATQAARSSLRWPRNRKREVSTMGIAFEVLEFSEDTPQPFT
jgi:hypothetical protein